MIGHSIPEYIFIRISIWSLQAVVPLSVAYTIASWYTGRFLYSPWLGGYALLEAAFYVLVYLPRRFLLQKAAIHPPPLSREERRALFTRCCARLREVEDFTGWFYSTTASSLKRENVREWLLWAFFGTPRVGHWDEWKEEIDEYIATVEKAIGHELEDGWNEDAPCMKVTLDPVTMLHRPFVWYMIVCIVDTITAIQLFRQGFLHFTGHVGFRCFPPRLFTTYSELSPHPELVYWYRPHRSKTKKPIVFFHGIGIGLWPYVNFFNELSNTNPDVGILAIENLSISMRITRPPLARDAMLAALTRVLDHHKLDSFAVAGHSYGTILAAHMVRTPALAPRIAALLLVDPIPFLLHQPAVAYNFVYRPPRTANEWQLWYFASRDPDIAHALARHFFWSENILWKEDLAGRPAAVVLSGRDQIVDAREVWRYLTGEDELRFRWKQDGLEVLYYADLDHAMVFDVDNRRRPMVEILERFVKVQGE
ncbi:alpha/beta-hydrolase [Obba rivulosa]|uniref:Alpha/beta-hydrolase n=1 Tax=Obba rivulosa TaxID=1052685 RepID=A0A8E2AXR7_9APHY|nr:alpha/beta-hydrolase [Obba rivulosa]